MQVNIETLISKEEVEKRIQEMADELSERYAGKYLKLVGILKGSVFFLTELAKRMTIPITMDFISISSYGNSMESSGILKFNKDLDDPIEGEDVLVVEDILDTGRTLSYVLKIFETRKPASLAVVTLLDKPSRRLVNVDLLMAGFSIEDRFVVGYGLDYAQQYRNLPYIGVIE
ncbi:MAG: hypoxanthine phosphoribosyltransferase [Eubacterium sp.]|nr:hypoxanthine phosphoribosyltransferase [Eubacterium sp.]